MFRDDIVRQDLSVVVHQTIMDYLANNYADKVTFESHQYGVTLKTIQVDLSRDPVAYWEDGTADFVEVAIEAFKSRFDQLFETDLTVILCGGLVSRAWSDESGCFFRGQFSVKIFHVVKKAL